MLLRVGCLTVVLAVAAVCATGAQDLAAPVHVPRFELGGQGALSFGYGGGEGFLLSDVGPRLTVNLTGRDAVELVTGALLFYDDVPTGLYFLQYKRVLRVSPARDAARLFITVGIGGDFDYDRQPEWRSPRPDGSIVVYPARTDTYVQSPWMFSFGIGAERVVARYLASRAEVQIGALRYGAVLLRGTVGVSVPVGGHYDRETR